MNDGFWTANGDVFDIGSTTSAALHRIAQPAENLAADQIRRRWKGKWRMRFVFGKGMVSAELATGVFPPRKK
jgi:hypothetical protein